MRDDQAHTQLTQHTRTHLGAVSVYRDRAGCQRCTAHMLTHQPHSHLLMSPSCTRTQTLHCSHCKGEGLGAGHPVGPTHYSQTPTRFTPTQLPLQIWCRERLYDSPLQAGVHVCDVQLLFVLLTQLLLRRAHRAALPLWSEGSAILTVHLCTVD